jgi:hypothetical protein
MTYLLSAIGQPPGGSSRVHINIQTIHRMTQNKQYIEYDIEQNMIRYDIMYDMI